MKHARSARMKMPKSYKYIGFPYIKKNQKKTFDTPPHLKKASSLFIWKKEKQYCILQESVRKKHCSCSKLDVCPRRSVSCFSKEHWLGLKIAVFLHLSSLDTGKLVVEPYPLQWSLRLMGRSNKDEQELGYEGKRIRKNLTICVNVKSSKGIHLEFSYGYPKVPRTSSASSYEDRNFFFYPTPTHFWLKLLRAKGRNWGPIF